MRQQYSAALSRVSTTDGVVRRWSRGARRVAREIERRYDLPHEATDSMLVWYYSGLWKRTVVHREGVLHQFPVLHRDYLEQTIDYRVPAEKFSELAAFNGSVIVDRTRGELTARCSSEEANFLLINLAHDIVLGKRTPEEARRMCAGMATALRMKWPMPYTSDLLFTADVVVNEAAPDTSDPDRSMKVMPSWRYK